MKLLLLAVVVCLFGCRPAHRWFIINYTIPDNYLGGNAEGEVGISSSEYPIHSEIDSFVSIKFLPKKRECYGGLIVKNIWELNREDYASFWKGHKTIFAEDKKEECCETWMFGRDIIPDSKNGDNGYDIHPNEKGSAKIKKAVLCCTQPSKSYSSIMLIDGWRDSLESRGNPILAADLIEDSDYAKILKRHEADSTKKNKQ